MEEGKPLRPLVISTASGMSSVAGRISITEDVGADRRDPVPELPAPMTDAPQPLATNLSDAASFFQLFYRDIAASLKECGDSFYEAVRDSIEGSAQLVNELAAAKTPFELCSLQAGYAIRQFERFSLQMSQARNAFERFSTASAETLREQMAVLQSATQEKSARGR